MAEDKPTEAPKIEPLSIIERAEAANIKAEANISRMEEIQKRNEELAAKQLLGGRAEAGTAPVVKEETAKEYKDRVMKGSV